VNPIIEKLYKRKEERDREKDRISHIEEEGFKQVGAGKEGRIRWKRKRNHHFQCWSC
jgi:hypothetical protein